MTRGLFRDADWAHITDGANDIPIPRHLYEANGYQPPFDELPTKDEFEARDS